MLAVENIVVKYTDSNSQKFDAVALKTAAFSAGQFTAISGPSGSGKTTLLHALSGIVHLTSGKIYWNGSLVSGLNETARDQWRRVNIGYMFQDFQLIPELSPLANVALAGTFGRHLVAENRAEALLEEFAVPVNRKRIFELSRGEQQRVAFARALYFDPPIILADEPTASLDKENGTLVTRRLRALADSGKIVISVSHDADLVKASDRNMQFSRGRLASESTP
jgi:putative ABC transport system ATP-binding protein